MSGCRSFSRTDLALNYNQIPVDETDIQNGGDQAFWVARVLRIPSGFSNAASTIQWLLNEVTLGLENVYM